MKPTRSQAREALNGLKDLICDATFVDEEAMGWIAIMQEALDQRERLLRGCRAALARLGGDGRDGTLGWHRTHPLLVQLRGAIAEAEGATAGNLKRGGDGNKTPK